MAGAVGRAKRSVPTDTAAWARFALPTLALVTTLVTLYSFPNSSRFVRNSLMQVSLPRAPG